jgi:hypothetical protein
MDVGVNAEPESCVAALDGDISSQRPLVARSPEAQRDFPLGIKQLTAARFGTSTLVRRAIRSTA